MGKTTKKTYEYIKTYIESFGYKLLSNKYINSSSKIEVQCDKGHSPYKVTFTNFYKGRRCPECAKITRSNVRRNSFNYVKDFISQVEGYELLSDTYKNNSTKLIIRCPKGHVFKMDFAHFKRGQRCPECDITKKKTYDEVKDYVESFNGYKLLSDKYINNITKLTIQCDKGHIFKMTFADFKTGYRCPKCAGCERKTIEEIYDYMKQYNHTLISNTYKNAHTKLLVRCPEGHEYEISWNNFKNGKRCPICQESKGESRSRQYFELLNINFEPQYIFKDCKNIEPLRYDFAVFYDVEKTKLAFLYEYDGEYHYLPIEGKKKLKYQQKLDNIKNQYCLQNNISLLRIPYWDFDNIEQILSEELSKYNLIA